MKSILGRSRLFGAAFVVLLILAGYQTAPASLALSVATTTPEASSATATKQDADTTLTGDGLVTVASDASVTETAEGLETALREQGLTVFAVIDHAANAEQASLELRPTRLILTGNPRLGTPLMQENQTVAIDLPQKFLVWEDAQGDVFITYNDPDYLAERHGLTGQVEILNTIANALSNFAETAAGADSGDTAEEAAPSTLYVAPDGTGDRCTNEVPCGSIQTAIDQAAAGDRISLAAGTYVENLTIPASKEGLQIAGTGPDTEIESAGAAAPEKEAPEGVSADIVLDIFSPNVTVEDLRVRHPQGTATQRDIGIFVRPPASGVTLRNLVVERLRTGDELEPTMPGSRGVLVFQATGVTVEESEFEGNYEDHIHLPTSGSLIGGNEVTGATRLGIVVIQESPDAEAVENVLEENRVADSGSDGIQIQGDRNRIEGNTLEDNGGYGLHLCAPGSKPACVPPDSNAQAEENVVEDNSFQNNALGAIYAPGENDEQSAAHAETMGSYPNAQLLVDTEWLAEQLDDPNLRIIDIRSSQSYANAHIPNAVHVPISAIASTVDGIPMEFDPDKVQETLNQIGLTPEMTVVIYDDLGMMNAARLFWTLEYIGHTDARVLNGGWNAWIGGDHPTSSAAPRVEATDYPLDIQPNLLITASELLERLDAPDVAIVDARSPQEYTGEVELAARGGHIPGAVNLVWLDTLTGGDTTYAIELGWQAQLRDADVEVFKSAAEIQMLLEEKGLAPDQEVITYCQTLWRGAHVYYVLRLMGYENVRGYDGSWAEWGNRTDLPVVTGSEPGSLSEATGGS